MGRLLAYLRSGRGLSAYALLTLGWMILVILEGAVVRATGSGAGCGDHWPLCNGQILPHHPRLATVIEFTHRSMTGICTALTLGLIGWTFLAHPVGARVRKAAVWAGFLLFTEALLGAVLVLGGFVERNASNVRVVVQSVHFTNTLLLMAALGLTWWWQVPRQRAEPTLPSAHRLAGLALLTTLLTGASGSVAALADTLFPSASFYQALMADFDPNSPLLLRMRWMHPAASVVTCLAVLGLAFACQKRRRVLLTLLGLQVLLGVGDVLWMAPLTLQVLHLFAADLLWIALVTAYADLRIGVQRVPATLRHLIPDPVATPGL